MTFTKFMRQVGKAAPRKRPRRIAKKLAARGGWIHHKPQSGREAMARWLQASHELGMAAGEAINRLVRERHRTCANAALARPELQMVACKHVDARHKPQLD